MEAVAGGLIFAPIIIAYSYTAAKGAIATAGFMAGAGWELYQYLDKN